jgi:hypothetical protein
MGRQTIGTAFGTTVSRASLSAARSQADACDPWYICVRAVRLLRICAPSPTLIPPPRPPSTAGDKRKGRPRCRPPRHARATPPSLTRARASPAAALRSARCPTSHRGPRSSLPASSARRPRSFCTSSCTRMITRKTRSSRKRSQMRSRSAKVWPNALGGGGHRRTGAKHGS